MIQLVEQVVVNVLGGRRHPRLPFWNASDDNPSLHHATFSVDIDKGMLLVNAYEVKEGVTWPDYLCAGDSYKNKFAATLIVKGDKTSVVPITDFIEITQENLDKVLSQFKKV